MVHELAIVRETDALIAVSKPSGLITHSDGRTVEPSLAEWLIVHYPELRAIGEPWVSPQGERVPIAGLVHRLDRATSGVLIAAKTNELFAHIKNEFKNRRVKKRYVAAVHEHMEDAEGRIIAEIVRSSEAPKRWYARACDVSDPRAAITNWTLIKNSTDPTTGAGVAFLELAPETGRTHQIRVHLASIGHPIIGDHLYAEDRPRAFGFERLALHADSVELSLPSGERVYYAAALPDDFSL